MSVPAPSLVALATDVAKLATTFQEQLDGAGLEQPSLESTGRTHYLDILENAGAVEARTKLIEACRSLLTLAQGPIDTLLVSIKANMLNIGVLRAIYQLRIAEAVPLDRSISIPDLAARLSVHADALRRLIRFAFTQSVFREPAGRPDHVEHTAISAAIPSISPIMWLYLGDTMKISPASLHFADSLSLETWPRPPLSFSDPTARNLWTIIKEDEPDGRGMEAFANAMKATLQYSQGDPGLFLAKAFDWAGLGDGAVVVDVGGGNGHNAVSLAKSFPNLKLVVQDMEKNEHAAAELIQQADLAGSGKVTFQGHDFFKPQPDDTLISNPRVYLVSRVLHDWSDEDSVQILQNLIPAMKGLRTKLLVVDRVLPDRPGDMPLHQEAQMRAMDLNMFLMFGNAGERSREQWVSLFRTADERLEITSVYTPPGSELSVVQVEIAK
ncbi:O-methyltransferase domain containing protein [Rhypophila decipiens]